MAKPETPRSRPPSKGYLTPRSLFIIASSFIYVIVIFTQFKLANLISLHHDTLTSPGSGVAGLSKRGSASSSSSSSNTDDNNQLYTQLSHQIAAKWNLTTPHATTLLTRQFHKPFDWNPQTDFFHFHHLYKSGGTSISDLMDKTIGLPQLGKERFQGILPGSYRSGDFKHEEALKDIEERLNNGTPRDQLPYKGVYAHTGVRPVYGPEATQTGKFYLKQFPHKRLRVVTMLRDPIDFRASNHAMIMCGLNHEVEVFNRKRLSRGLEKICSPAEGLNISALIDEKVRGILEKCDLEAANPEKKIVARQHQCQQEREGVDTLIHCRSASNLLHHDQYQKHYRSMFKGVMGRFHKGQAFGGTAYGRMGYGYESAEMSEGYSVEAVEEYTLEDLGGLERVESVKGGKSEPDFVWFGITERMKESVILFYYTFGVRPVKKVPNARVQECRPTCEFRQHTIDDVFV